MRTRKAHKLLSLLLTVCMVFSLLPASIWAEDTATATWTKTTIDKITSEDTVAITMTSADGNTTWVLPTAGKGKNNQPLAVSVTPEGDTLTTAGAASDYGWTLTRSDAGFTISSGDSYLYVTATNNGVRIGSTKAVWGLIDGYLTAPASDATRYLGVYNGQDWRCYTLNKQGNIADNIKGQTLNFWKLSGGSETPVDPQPDDPTPEEPTISTIAEALAASSGEFTVKGVVTLVDGKNIYIQDETGGICLYFSAAPSGIALGDTVIGTGTRAAYKGLPELSGASFEKSEGLTLTARETTLGSLTDADICTYVTIKNLEVTKISDNSTTVTDASGATMVIFKAVADPALAVGDKIHFTGAVGMFNNLQLRNTVAGEIVRIAEEPDPYANVDAAKNVYELTDKLSDGDTVLVYNAGSTKALTSTVKSNYYLEGKDFTAQVSGENTIIAATPEEAAVSEWTVKVNEDGTYTFTQGDKTLAGKQVVNGNKTNNNLTLSADDNAAWALAECNAENSSYYVYNAGIASRFADEGGRLYLEWYASKDEFSLYDTSRISEGAFGMTFYKLVRPATAEPDEPAGSAYGLTSKLATGDEVILYNETSGMGLGNTMSGYNVAGVALTPKDGVITTDSTAVVWTVTVNSDGTYTFTQGDKTLGGAVNGTHNNLVLTGATYTNWTPTGPDSSDFNYFLALADMANNYGTTYLEYHNGFTLYGSKAPDKGAFGITFYKKGAEPETPATEPDEPAGNTYGLTSKLTTGDKVILYNETSGMGVGNTIASHKITGVALTPKDGVITTDNTAVVWTVTVNADGTYTFTQGNNTLGGVVSGTYNNLVVADATYTNWTLTGPDSSDFNYFLRLDDMSNSYGKMYLEYYKGFTLYGSSSPDKAAFGITFYKQGAEPETPAGTGETGGLITSLDQLTDGATVAIYSPGHKTAISTKPNGDWYLKANNATVENGKVVNFTADFVWKVKKNDDGTFSFYANDDETHSITVWPSGNYAELSLNVGTYPDNTWTLTPAKTPNCFYANSPTVSGSRGPAYIEAFVRNEAEVFSGYFTSPSNSKFTENEFALQFYLVNPDDAVAAYDDGEWDGVLTKGKQYVAYNATAGSSIGLWDEANFSMKAIPTAIEGDKANAGNGAYVFTVDTMGRYYSFKAGGKYLATNEKEELFFIDPNEDGSAPETAKWFLTKKDGGYIIYNKEATYNGTPVCIEYYSSVFSGWTFSTKNEVGIYLFNFYEVTDGTKIYADVVQDPSVAFDCEDFRYVEQDYAVAFTLDDLAPEITDIQITYTAGDKTGTVDKYESSEDGKGYHFTIPAADIDAGETLKSFTITVTVKNSYGIEYTGEKVVEIIDKPFFEDLTPAPNAQTRDDKRPVVSAKVGNVGENPTFTMTVNGQAVEAAFENGVLTYTPAADLADGRTTVVITVKRADGVEAEKSWTFIVGTSGYQLYFGQLHSHTTYSDGSGTLDAALDYVASLPESANVQFVAFTDHSNYFDTTSAANPADSLNDKSLMTPASRALWDEYKSKVAAFNEKQAGSLIAIAGYEMTWSGGPGHINTFDSDGLVSRNNAELNNKNGDAGMKLYYETINKGQSLNQFNHPGTTFGNFTDFSYWDKATDDHMFLVEVGNGEGQIGAGGYYPSYEQYTMALDKGWHVAPTNNQDNHKGRWGNANDARDVILTNDFSEQGIYDAIRALRVYATEDKNLQITYTVNGESMGTIFTDENAPEKLNVAVTLYDPDASDSVAKVELIVDGGVTAYTWDNAAELAEGSLTAELDSEYSYYYVRVTQKDGDLAVTAPVWVGHALKVGIDKIAAASETVYKGEEATLVTSLFNNEETAATVKSLVYSVGGTVIGTDTKGYAIEPGKTLDVNFAHTFDTAKLTTVTVTAIVTVDGKDYTYTANVELDVLDKETEGKVTSIADVRAASKPDDTGYRFTIEGVVTSNASGYDKDTAFFDCIYVQDDTAGICCFPVSGDFKVGDKVRIVGHTDFYQGEPELQVQTIEVIGSGSVEPTEIKASQLNDRSAEGKLVTIKGTVESFEEANGLIQTIMVKDEAGNLARVFIDGYITTAKEVENCVVGANITVTGLASYDDTFNAPEGPFPRIRIRDRADVVCESAGAGQITLNPGEADETIVTLNEDGTVPALPTPADRDGYVFGGWFDAKEGGSQVSQGDALSPDVTFLYARWYELRVTFSDDVVIPAALTGTYPTVDAMKDAMMQALLAGLNGKTLKGSTYAEMKIEYNKDGQWLPLEAADFPAKGVSVTMPYPAGTGSADTFAVLHLFGEDCNGHKAGENEIPAVTNGQNGITFTVNGTSPVLVGQVDTATPETPAKPGDSAKTGDTAALGLWAALMVVSALGVAYVVTRKKGKREI